MRCPHDHHAVPVRGSYNVTAMCLRAMGLQFFQICHYAELNKIIEATMPVNPHDDRTFSLPRHRDQARGRLGRYSRPRGRNFARNGTQGEVAVSLKKKKFFFFFFFFFYGDSFSFCHHTNASYGVIIRHYTTTALCFSFH